MTSSQLLTTILTDNSVTDGETTYHLHSHVDPEEGRFIQRVIEHVRPATCLELGMAYGISTLFICEALERLNTPARHIVVDPFQHDDWHGIGLRHVRECGYDRFVEFHEDRSEYVLPRLAAEGRTIDVALVDGWHTFDQALVEFYYINRILRVGGIVIFDDADWPGIERVLRHALTYPAYEVFEPKAAGRRSLLGAMRRRLAMRPAMARWMHPTLRDRSWDLGLGPTLVALTKVAPDQRPNGWHQDF